jgi:uncharacterized protein
MAIDWMNFTPGPALAGGALIGLSAAVLYVANGRIAGISGMLGILIQGRERDIGWRLMFLLGLITSSTLWLLLLPGGLPVTRFEAATPGAWAMLAGGGLLVGFGTRLGRGCTSGHGVCGLARLSKRSAVAVLCFMSGAGLTVFLTRHVLGG